MAIALTVAGDTAPVCCRLSHLLRRVLVMVTLTAGVVLSDVTAGQVEAAAIVAQHS